MGYRRGKVILSSQECKEEERGLAQVEGRRDARARSSGATAAGQVSDGVTSYLVATSPEVLTQLLRENEARGDQFNPALYTNPANALNITKVDFAPVDGARHPPPSPLSRRPRQTSHSSSHSLERRDCATPRSLPGSAHSTLSRGHSPAAAPISARRPSAARSGHSSSQVLRRKPVGGEGTACVASSAPNIPPLHSLELIICT